MDTRAAKLALARKKLKDHQGKKVICSQKGDTNNMTMEGNVDQGTVLSNSTEQYTENVGYAPNESKELKCDVNIHPDTNPDVNVTEILISNKRNLELQVGELQSKLNLLESEHAQTLNNFDISRKQINNLESELKNLHQNYIIVTRELQDKDKLIKELNDIKKVHWDQNNHLAEQLEFTKTMLTAKETENASLHSQLTQIQNQLDGTNLQLHQLTNGSSIKVSQTNQDGSEVNEVLLQKIALLEQQLKASQKERDQVSIHYEHYVAELNDQLKMIMKKNEEMNREIDTLSTRESSLVEQISEMEIRMQNLSQMKETMKVDTTNLVNIDELQKNYADSQENLQQLNIICEDMKQKLVESEAKIRDLSEAKESDSKQDDISLSKLQADMASDKIAAQRATEQNKKLKTDLQELEEAFVKMSKDKLELTEKLAAEKFLNRELTIKLAEVEEKAKDMHIKLKAKDDEMIRLQNNLRTTEKECERVTKELEEVGKQKEELEHHENIGISFVIESPKIETEKHNNEYHTDCDNKIEGSEIHNESNSLLIKNDDAMGKLQERFLKIMGEVADLSDEKHRLEHIILQLQNETDTICEYVALYQQQRSLLKKRDEERNTQIKIFQEACNNLQRQIEELHNLLVKFAEDKALSEYFLNDSRKEDLQKVMNLISHLKNNCLIDPKQSNSELKNFYPCSCCSGKLIDV